MTNKKLTNRQAIGVLDGLWSNPLFGEVHRQAFEIGIKAIKALEQEPYSDIEAIYNAGYKDGKHDGYYSTLIANGGEPEHYGRGLVEISEDKE